MIEKIIFYTLIIILLIFKIIVYIYARPGKKAERTYSSRKLEEFKTYIPNIKYTIITIIMLVISLNYHQDNMPKSCNDSIHSIEEYLEYSNYSTYKNLYENNNAELKNIISSMNNKQYISLDNEYSLSKINYPKICDINQMENNLNDCVSEICNKYCKHFHKWGIHIKRICVSECHTTYCDDYSELMELYEKTLIPYKPIDNRIEYSYDEPRQDAPILLLQFLKLIRDSLNIYNVTISIILFIGLPHKMNKLSSSQSILLDIGQLNKIQWIIIYLLFSILVLDFGNFRSDILNFVYESIILKLTTNCRFYTEYNRQSSDNYINALNIFNNITDKIIDMNNTLSIRIDMLNHYGYCNELAYDYAELLTSLRIKPQFLQEIPLDDNLKNWRFIGFSVYILIWPMISTLSLIIITINNPTIQIKYFYVDRNISYDNAKNIKLKILSSNKNILITELFFLIPFIILGIIASFENLDFIPFIILISILSIIYIENIYNKLLKYLNIIYKKTFKSSNVIDNNITSV